MAYSHMVENDTCFLFSYFYPLCALLCKLSGVFVTAWCWRKQQQAELWIANVPWGGRPWFDILNKLQIRQAGRSGAAYFFPFPQWDMRPCGNGNRESLDTFLEKIGRERFECVCAHACVCLLWKNAVYVCKCVGMVGIMVNKEAYRDIHNIIKT